jgi:hypothetical protein
VQVEVVVVDFFEVVEVCVEVGSVVGLLSLFGSSVGLLLGLSSGLTSDPLSVELV